MNKVEVNRSVSYDGPGEFDMKSINLHGKENGCEAFTVGMSHLLPGGGTEYVEAPVELVYFVLDGQVSVLDEDGNVLDILHKYDSMHFAPGEGKQILNGQNYTATMLVITSRRPE